MSGKLTIGHVKKAAKHLNKLKSDYDRDIQEVTKKDYFSRIKIQVPKNIIFIP